MKYRVVKIVQVRYVTPIFKVVSVSERRTVIKSGFNTEEKAKAWNTKYGHSSYTIESY